MTSAAASPLALDPPQPSWRRAAAFGMLGGVTLVALEMLVLPSDLTRADWIALAMLLMVQWSLAATVIAYVATYAEARVRVPALVAWLLATAVALSAAFAFLFSLAMQYGSRFAVGREAALEVGFATGEFAPMSTFLYNLWILLFFGGLFTAGCVLGRRAERSRDVLARAEIERSRTEALLGEAELESLRAHVDPSFLLRVVTEIEVRYGVRSGDADRLLDALVGFLRSAMPGVRGNTSTLRAELQLADAYGRVWSEIDPERAGWRIHSDRGVPDTPFPSMWLLPVLDAWSSGASASAICDVRIAMYGSHATLTLDSDSVALPRGFPMTLDYRLRVGLRAVFADRAALALRTPATRERRELSLTFPLPVVGGGYTSRMRSDAQRISS
jgi:hypothetical protein